MKNFRFVLWVGFTACGGAKTSGPGTPHEPEPSDAAPRSAWGGGAPDANASGLGDTGVAPVPEGPSVPLGFRLKNAGKDDLVFAIDKGWQPVIFAYSGKPPKAKPALLFPTACTASCEAAPLDMCPVCRESTDPKVRKKQEKEETKREVTAPGKAVEVPWDGKVFAYEKATGKKHCKCWRKVDPAADSYTVKACGLRPAKEAGATSRIVCAETQVTLPAEPGAAIELTFGP